ncbi:unnamed protein product [Auanema sp. JU1783]|nr:unnamed protein product [Auanema sp. JU1783]
MQVARFCSVASTSTNLPRTVRSCVRELALARQFVDEGSKTSLKKLVKVSLKQKESNELTSRVAALGAFLALKHDRLDDARQCLKKVTSSPPIVKSSLDVMYLVKMKEVNEALDILDDVLNTEQQIFNTENSSITDDALDCLHAEITKSKDTTDQMRRFRKLQRLLTTYKCRSTKPLLEILNSSLETDFITDDRVLGEDLISDKVVEDFPHFLHKTV